MKPPRWLCLALLLLLPAAGCSSCREDGVTEAQVAHTRARVEGKLKLARERYPNLAPLLEARWQRALAAYRGVLQRGGDRVSQATAVSRALEPIDEPLAALEELVRLDGETLALLDGPRAAGLTPAMKSQLRGQVTFAQGALRKAAVTDAELVQTLKRAAREAATRHRAVTEAVATLRGAGEVPGTTLPALVPGKGVRRLVLPEREKPLDLLLGTPWSALGLEWPQPKAGAAVRLGPHRLRFDAGGKLAAFTVALSGLPEGIFVAGAAVPREANLVELKQFLPGCGEPEPAKKGLFRLDCPAEKLLAYGAEPEQKVELFFTTSDKTYPYPGPLEK